MLSCFECKRAPLDISVVDATHFLVPRFRCFLYSACLLFAFLGHWLTTSDCGHLQVLPARRKMNVVLHAVSRQRLCFAIFLFSFLALTALAQDDGEYNDDFVEQQQVAQRRQFQRSGGYDPHSRDFTERCMRLAQFSAEKACDVFNVCCSEDMVLNKLNGDRCQDPDPTNGCTLNLQVSWPS